MNAHLNAVCRLWSEKFEAKGKIECACERNSCVCTSMCVCAMMCVFVCVSVCL